MRTWVFSSRALISRVASIPLPSAGRTSKTDPTVLATHHFSMDKAMEAYDVFADAAKTHALKVVLISTPVPAETELEVAVTATT